jgi:hypothetical protein
MLTPATITVEFLGNYEGPHRVCWRVQGSGNPYVCTNIVNCSGGGNICTAEISIMVDTELCDPTTFEGYIQATCNLETSTTGQIPFTVVYNPTPSCNAYILTNNTGDTYDFTSQELGLNCDGTARPAFLLADGGSIYLCGIAGMPLGTITTFNVLADPSVCCGVCESYTVNSTTSSPVTIYYVACGNKEFSITTAPPIGDPGLTICAVAGSVTGDAPFNSIKGVCS